MGHKHRSGDDQGGRAERAREVGRFRYALIRPAADPGLTTRQRGRMVRELAEAEHVGPFGDRVRVSRVTVDRWIRAWGAGGFDALVPSTRHVEPRTPASVLELAAALKREVPGAHRGAGRRDSGRVCRVGALAAHPASTLRPPGAQHPPRRVAAGRVRTVRGCSAE